ncbi:MAG: MarR family winged helix-turn-helix transcriptional regulator [Clostridia bacterium]
MRFENGYFYEIARMELLYKQYFQREVAEYRFTPGEITVLMFLFNNAPALDTAKDIARFKGVSKGLIARSVDRLAKDGFLHTATDDSDRRIVHLRLEGKSREIAHRLENAEKNLLESLGVGIDAEALRITDDTLKRLHDNLEELTKEGKQI